MPKSTDETPRIETVIEDNTFRVRPQFEAGCRERDILYRPEHGLADKGAGY